MFDNFQQLRPFVLFPFKLPFPNESNLRQDDPAMVVLCRAMRLFRMKKFRTIKYEGDRVEKGWRELLSQRVGYFSDAELLPSAFHKRVFFYKLAMATVKKKNRLDDV